MIFNSKFCLITFSWTFNNLFRYIREFLAEALGTFALVIFGDGAVSQVVLGNTARGDAFFGGFLNICFGYGLALMIGIAISGGVSGAHLNPAVTLAMAVLKKTKPIQVNNQLLFGSDL